MTYPSFVNWSGISRRASILSLAVLALFPAVLTRYTRGQVRVTISPANVTLPTVARQAFTGTVSGSSNTAVILQVDGAGRGNSTAGLVSTTLLGTVEEAIYLLPASVPHPATVSVTAVSRPIPQSLLSPRLPFSCRPGQVIRITSQPLATTRTAALSGPYGPCSPIPQFSHFASTPPKLEILPTSGAVNAGTNLGVNTVGVLD